MRGARMKRFLLCTIVSVLLAAAGCGLTGGQQARMNETTRAQVETLLSEAEMHMNHAAQGQGFMRRFSPELGEKAKILEESARLNIQFALDKSYEAYNLEPRWAPTNHAIAACELALGNSERAIEFARRTLYLTGDRPEAWVIIGTAYLEKAQKEQDPREKKREYEKAINAYENFIKERPEHIGVPFLQTTIEVIKEEMEK